MWVYVIIWILFKENHYLRSSEVMDMTYKLLCMQSVDIMSDTEFEILL